MYISIGKAALLLGVSVSTVRRWDKSGKLPATMVTEGKHRRYELKAIIDRVKGTRKKFNDGSEPKKDKELSEKLPVVAYARVSSTKQKTDLKNQIQFLERYVEQNEWNMITLYSDIGSGLNDKRKGLIKLLKDIPVINPAKIIVTYRDRLARFGTT